MKTTCVKIFLVAASLVQLAVGHLHSGQSIFAGKYGQRPISESTATLNSAHRHLANVGDIDVLNVQRKWVEWNFCTNAYPIKSFAPQDIFVPESYVFLAGFPTGFKSDNVTCNDVTTRTGEIGVGKQSVFFPLFNYFFWGVGDDYELGRCGTNTSEASEALRYATANDYSADLNDEATKAFLIYKIDNVKETPFYIYDNRTYLLQGCRTSKEYYTLIGIPDGDTCNTDTFPKFNNIDSFPNFGWYGNDTREWVDGEKHTYEFGITGPDYCITAKYILTAKEECVGFCILLWIRRLLRLLFFWL
jgi:hypothetical protein